MKNSLIFLIFVLLLLFAVRGWWNNQLAAVSLNKDSKTVILAKGQSLNEIAEKLKKEGFIKSAYAFKILVGQKGWDKKLQAGTYKLSQSMSAEEVAKVLTGVPSEIWVTLLEGWRVEEMADKLNGELKIDNGEFVKMSAEGYMFPDTYLFPREITVSEIVKAMTDNFEKKFSGDLKAQIRKLSITDEQGLILASIVEREARSDTARKMVASILLKRLKIGMGLNADATIQYALGYQMDEKSWWKRHLGKDDLKIDSSYNTYLYRGLPPTPICNPSLSSLKAVADADTNVPYLYYYHDSKGNSHYAKTLEEHNQNVADNP